MHPERFYEPGLDDFAALLHGRIRDEGGENPRERRGAFARDVIGQLHRAAELEQADFQMARGGTPISGYSVDANRRSLDIFVVLYTGATPPALLTERDVAGPMTSAVEFIKFSRQRVETEPAASIGKILRSRKSPVERVRVFLLTDGRVEESELEARSIGRLDVSFHVWDLPRLYTLDRSMAERDTVEVDLEGEFGSPLACLQAPGPTFEYRTFLTVIPASVLHELYARFGPRIVQPNVRSYLQARGSINRGIRATILNEPDRFLAYNNGLTAVCQKVHTRESEQGQPIITGLSDFQIINGVQTTASIFHTARRARRRLADVHVQAKIIEIAPAAYDTFLPLVSRFANSQNKVLGADFAANDSFHMRIERLSRSVPTPTRPATFWFYERARGQYQEALNRLKGAEDRAAFRREYPGDQRFTKLDLARYENIYDGRPHVVCQGTERNFMDFSRRLRSRAMAEEVDETYFTRLIAKAILTRRSEEIVSRVGQTGHSVQTAAYTVAYIRHHEPGLVDLDAIWDGQDVGPKLRSAIELASLYVSGMITNPIGARKVSEWCKKPACLDRVLRLDIRLPAADRPGKRGERVPDQSRAPTTTQEVQVVARSLELSRKRRT